MTRAYFERVLLVAGEQNSGKSTQLRSMFLDPRLGRCRKIPQERNITVTYELSTDRSLYLRLSSPHEKNESLKDFIAKIRGKASSGRWCVCSAMQIAATDQMPGLIATVKGINSKLSPERIRVAILSPDQNGIVRSDLTELVEALQAISTCEVITIDARDRRSNGLLLADTFDFT